MAISQLRSLNAWKHRILGVRWAPSSSDVICGCIKGRTEGAEVQGWEDLTDVDLSFGSK